MFRWIVTAGLALALMPACAPAMTMRVVDDEVILSGPVVASDGDQFKTILNDNPSIKLVLFWNSPGGLTAANRAISAMIIEHKLNTAIGGYCISACSEMFLAGVERNFTDVEPLASTSIGFHGNYAPNGTLDPEPRLQRLKADVLTRTGGKADPALVDRWVHFADKRTRFDLCIPELTRTAQSHSLFNATEHGPTAGITTDAKRFSARMR